MAWPNPLFVSNLRRNSDVFGVYGREEIESLKSAWGSCRYGRMAGTSPFYLVKRQKIALFTAGALLCALVPLTVSAAAPTFRSQAGAGRWSDPQAWGGTVPGPGAKVIISSGSTVVLDASPPALKGVRVDGTLKFKDKDLELKTKWLIVHGALRIGREGAPFTHSATITLTGPKSDNDVMGMGTKVLGIMGGTLDLHGEGVTSWTHLTSTAAPGARSIQVADADGWRAGDRIAIASSDYWMSHDDEATITQVNGHTIELDRDLDWRHWGEMQTFQGHDVDERAEVGLLSRNIVIRGDADSDQSGFGGQMMIMEGSVARIDGVEFDRMGQRKQLRRYPVHFHMHGNASASYLKGSAIHHSNNRCVTVHGTNDLLVQNNVCYDHQGHGFFLEDGAERDNRFLNNLGFGTRSVEDGLLPTDERPATFWITNPDNVFRNNAAAGSDGVGFWYALPRNPTGLSENDDIWPRRTPLGAFENNIAHSNNQRGLNVDDGPRPNGEVESAYYAPVADPTDDDSDPVEARFEGFTAYFNRDRGVWLRGAHHVVSGAVLADNRSGATFASSESFLEDSFVIGETANKGMTEDWEDVGPNGRALPFFWEPEAQITGFEFYDGRVGVRNTTFANYNDNPVRPSGALGYLAPDAFSIDPKNFAENVSFIDSEKVYLAPVENGMDGDASKVFIDRDGSVTGTAGRAVVVDNPFLLTAGCVAKPAWGAHVCDSEYTSLLVATDGGPDAIKPLKLTRGDGTVQRLMGCCDESEDAITSLLADRNYAVDFNTSPNQMRFVLYRGRGHWLRLSIHLNAAPKVKRWGYNIPSVGSSGALDQTSESSYFYDAAGNELHLKIVAEDTDWEEIQVTRN